MKDSLKIEEINAIEVLDSRGNPTVQVEVITDGGFLGTTMVPSGASTGTFEAVEIRDNEQTRYLGKGVNRVIENIDRKISKKLIGKNVYEQIKIDQMLIELDGTKNKEKLGANATLGVSIAIAKAAADSLGMSLYNYIGGANAKLLPIPMMNILNGGKHSDNNLNIQEFMIMPIVNTCFKEKLRMCVEIYHRLKNVLKLNGYSTSVGDEGGFAPNLKGETEALDYIVEAIVKAGYKPREEIGIALDIASTEMFEAAKKMEKNGYYFWKTGEFKTSEEMIEYLDELRKNYPILSIEDGLSEEDWEWWTKLTKRMGDDIQLVGDDLFVTNPIRLEKGIKAKAANGILIKPNQIGTLTETLDTIELAKKSGYKTIISHRSGETEDTTIADIAVRYKCRANKNRCTM